MIQAVVSVIKVTCLLLILLNPSLARAADFGFTPSHVYGIWLNINQAFIALLNHSPLTSAQRHTITRLQPDTFLNKQPKDVYQQVEIVKQDLEHTFQLPVISYRPAWVDHYHTLQYTHPDNIIHPSSVFILSSQLLRALVQQYINTTQAQQSISEFYIDRDVRDKSPNDVFAQVDLFKRRLLRYQQFRQAQGFQDMTALKGSTQKEIED